MFNTLSPSLTVRTLACVTTVVGIVVFALLIGIVSDHIGEFVEGLRKGRAAIMEEVKRSGRRLLRPQTLPLTCSLLPQNHTIILNFNPKGIPIIIELLNAKESEGGGAIVILSDIPKLELEATIRDELGGDYKGSRVICRCGSTRSAHELSRLSLDTAKSVIVLATEHLGMSSSRGGTTLHTVLQVDFPRPRALPR